jgi:hypothetical protein
MIRIIFHKNIPTNRDFSNIFGFAVFIWSTLPIPILIRPHGVFKFEIHTITLKDRELSCK